MKKWNVKVKVRVDEVVEFDRVVETETKEQAIYLAEETIGDYDVYEALKEKDAVALASFESEAEEESEAKS
jgi:hypothetical protein